MESVKCLTDQDVFVKKALGLGITELLLRYMSWLCVRDSCMIVTGPRINLAEELVDRIHSLFMNRLEINCKQTGPPAYTNYNGINRQVVICEYIITILYN
jgi:late competence protein required for DNA uptake (superfamily II DNA/RNA helicase)